MASMLNESNLERRLQTVTNTQESIQTLSLWCLHHKAHYKKIIDAWMKVMKKAKSGHRLALFYLANDVIQNSKRKNVNIFNEPWMGALKQATALVQKDKIKTQIERIFKVWGDRSVYDSTFIAELQELLAVEKKSQVTADEKILADFKPQKMIDKIKKHKKLESEVNMKQTQLTNLKVDVCSSESLRQLKDKAHGTKFTKEFEEATSKLEEFVQILDKQQQERASLIEILEKGEIFYNTQRKEAKIVANAYKNFGTRVSNLKQKLEERLPALSSPVPSPTFDAPSPEDSSAECSPSKNEPVNKDNVEAIDMEMSDDETDAHVTSKANKGNAPPLESPASPDRSPAVKEATPVTNNVATKSPLMSPAVDASAKPTTPSFATPTTPSLSVGVASTQPSSLEARLSSLMQNLPAFTSGLQGSFLNPNSITVPGTNNIVHIPVGSQVVPNKEVTAPTVVNDLPIRTIPLPPPVGGPGAVTDGAETPVKDEESGTGSATPLQDEDREANSANTSTTTTPIASNPVDGQNAISEFLKKLSSSLSSSNLRSPQNNLGIATQNMWDAMQLAKDAGSRSAWFPDSPSNTTLKSRLMKGQMERPPPLLPPPIPDMFFPGYSPMQKAALNPTSPKSLQPSHPASKHMVNIRGPYDYNGSTMDSGQYGSAKKDGTSASTSGAHQARPKGSQHGTLPPPPPPPPPPPLFPLPNPNIVELTQSHELDSKGDATTPKKPVMVNQGLCFQSPVTLPYHGTTGSLAHPGRVAEDATAVEEAKTGIPMAEINAPQMSSNLKPIPLVSFAESEGQTGGGSANLERIRLREEGDKHNPRRKFLTNVSKIETLDSRREPWTANEGWGPRGHEAEGRPMSMPQEWGKAHGLEARGHHGHGQPHFVQQRFPGGPDQRNFAPRRDFPQKRSWDNFEHRGGSYGGGPPPKRLAPRSQMFGPPRPRFRPPYTNRY